jgi:hypothetical protein
MLKIKTQTQGAHAPHAIALTGHADKTSDRVRHASGLIWTPDSRTRCETRFDGLPLSRGHAAQPNRNNCNNRNNRTRAICRTACLHIGGSQQSRRGETAGVPIVRAVFLIHRHAPESRHAYVRNKKPHAVLLMLIDAGDISPHAACGNAFGIPRGGCEARPDPTADRSEPGWTRAAVVLPSADCLHQRTTLGCRAIFSNMYLDPVLWII